MPAPRDAARRLVLRARQRSDLSEVEALELARRHVRAVRKSARLPTRRR